MSIKKKDNVFIVLSGILLVQVLLEFILLKQGRTYLTLQIINYFHLLEISVITGWVFYYITSKYSANTHQENMKKFHGIMEETSLVYYFQQLFHNSIITIIIAMIFALIQSINGSITFLIGYGISSIIGWIGVKVANKINIRMANMALHHDKREAENVGIYSGLIMGMILLIPLMGALLSPFIIRNSLMFCFGASMAAILTRLSGGFFTKSADIAADIVGKLDYQLPEDDIRNPAVLADNVGDIVGDCIGSAQSIFAITCFILKICAGNLIRKDFHCLSFIIGIFILSMIIGNGLFFITCNKRSLEQRTILFLGGNITVIILAMLFYKTIFYLNFKTFLMGLISVLINGFTVYLFTAPINKNWYGVNAPIKDLAESSQWGAGINVLKGMAWGKICTCVVLLEVIALNIINFWFTDFVWFGLEFALGILSLAPFVMVIDMFGPVADNSGGLMESVSDESLSIPGRAITDEMDQFGNMTKAIAKVYSYVILLAILYQCVLDKNITLNFLNIIGGIIGCLLIMIFNGSSMMVVLSITTNIIQMVKRTFEDNPKILTGEQDPDYKDIIKKLTNEVIAKSHNPFYITMIITVLFILIFFGIFKQSSTINIANWTVANVELFESFSPSTIGLLQFTMGITGITWGLYMSITGGAWDNCKKFIEKGNYGGKKSPTHSNAVIGDMVGDIYKDTTGPAIAPLILVIYCVTELLSEFIQKIIYF